MARTLQNMKGRRESGTFSMLIHAYFQSEEYAELSPRAVKALVDLYCQFRVNKLGFGNNGDLCAAWKTMSKMGWKSKSQLHKAIDELLARGWIILTRQGGRHCPSLYAVTFLGIDQCNNKLDVSSNPVPANSWKYKNRGNVIEFPRSGRGFKKKTLPLDTGHIAPRHGAIRVLGFANYPATRVNQTSFGRFGAPRHGHLLRIYQAA